LKAKPKIRNPFAWSDKNDRFRKGSTDPAGYELRVIAGLDPAIHDEAKRARRKDFSR
jgi:hypothetical protein